MLVCMLTETSVRNALKTVKYPGFSRDIISFGIVKDVTLKEGNVTVGVELSSAKPEVAQQIKTDCETALRQLEGAKSVVVEIRLPGGAASGQPAAPPLAPAHRIAGLRRIVAVASGKGGVGKSTVAVNLACGFAQLGQRIGLLDCDIYGPSIPLMMGVRHQPTISPAQKFVPITNHGVKLMSMGFLLEADTPVIWRGPMIVKTIQQFFDSVEWGELDCLLVDLPPGTGDAQLTLCQTVPLDGGLVVTTPQEASLGVVRKGIGMFNRLNVPVLGLVENMSYFTAPSGERIDIFGHGGGQQEAARQQIPFLGEIPLFPEIRLGGDQGIPVVVNAPKSAPARAFLDIAEALRAILQ
jgi:ATP-binding protein involved in chromosome partitioning